MSSFDRQRATDLLCSAADSYKRRDCIGAGCGLSEGVVAGCRYYTMIEGGQNKKDWSKAEMYYLQAVNVFPEGAAFTSLG